MTTARLAKATRELEALIQDESRAITLVLSPAIAWQLFATIQFACGDHDYPDAAVEKMETLGRLIQEQIATTPALSLLAEEGWGPTKPDSGKRTGDTQ